MNIDVLFPAMTGDLAQLGQSAASADPGQEGQEFEDMLVQQSKASNAQRKEESNSKKPEEKQKPAKTEEKSTQEDEVAEEGGQLAAALVTSQPVVPFELVSVPEVQYTQEGAVILEAAPLEGVAEQPGEAPVPVAGVLDTAVQQPEQAVEFAPQQAAAEVQPEAAAQQEAPMVEAQDAQPQVEAPQDGQVKVVASHTQPRQEAKPEEDAQEDHVFQESTPVFHDVKAAPVKVADVQRPVDVEEPEAPQQLANQVAQAIEQGESMVRIQLNPANLGSVTIELTRDAAGAITIMMHPETARAYSALSQTAHNLGAMLMEEGHFVSAIQVEMPEENQNPNMFMDPNGHNGQAKENEEERKKKQQNKTEGVSAADFLSQLRLGLVGMDSAQ